MQKQVASCHPVETKDEGQEIVNDDQYHAEERQQAFAMGKVF